MAKKQSDGENGRIGAFVALLIAAGLAGLAFTGATVIIPSYLELKGTQILRTASVFWSEGLSSNLMATLVTSLVYAVWVWLDSILVAMQASVTTPGLFILYAMLLASH